MSGAFDDWMKTVQAGSENDLSGFLPPATAVPSKLHEAMRYALLGGGKRVRPLLVYAAGTVVEGGKKPDKSFSDPACTVFIQSSKAPLIVRPRPSPRTA